MGKTELGIKAQRFWLFPLTLDFYLTMPGGKQIGPEGLQAGHNIWNFPRVP